MRSRNGIIQVSTMKTLLGFSFLLLGVSAAISQERAPMSFQDDLLDRLVGTWKVKGVVHGNVSNQMLQADWVLHHQFLRVSQKSRENVAHRDFPFEGVFFIGYDDSEKRYVAHLMDVFGGRDSESIGYGKRTGDQVSFEFKQPDGLVTEEFTYAERLKAWHIVSAATTPDGKTIPILDLTATPAK
jgi:hypothetical protein